MLLVILYATIEAVSVSFEWNHLSFCLSLFDTLFHLLERIEEQKRNGEHKQIHRKQIAVGAERGKRRRSDISNQVMRTDKEKNIEAQYCVANVPSAGLSKCHNLII